MPIAKENLPLGKANWTCPIDPFRDIELELSPFFGSWLNLVERCVRDADVAGWNPVAPTISLLLACRSSRQGKVSIIMKKKNSTQETLDAVRRNTAYQIGRTLALVYSVLIVLIIGILVYVGTVDLPTNQKLASLFGSIIGGAAIGAMSYQYLVAHYDQADALLQVAKFQQRSIRSRSDALALVEKIREEVNEEGEEEELDEKDLSAEQKDEISVDPNAESAES